MLWAAGVVPHGSGARPPARAGAPGGRRDDRFFAFVEVRRRGSHIVMQRRARGSTTTVPVPDHGEIRLGTLQSIIRQSGLPRSLFEAE